ncbi:MAG: HyaD/HybD family hydrogenase maturation endopeptidase [Syntrophobacteraceae bacterium]|jgi:hydrogenase maturation protease|nr:HyaD/HybD family hydrogenase maturation endopeptidase [Syntrophobacteraceae bacterium]
MDKNRILVLGVGNILLHDEGVGVRVIEELQARYEFSDNVEFYDGGTLGLRLLDPITGADWLIVVDAVQNGEPPGTIYRLDADDLNKRVTFKSSLHQLDLVETLAYAEILGKRPHTVIVGIEPADISPWGLELTEVVQARMADLCERVLGEIQEAGGRYRPRASEDLSQRNTAAML